MQIYQNYFYQPLNDLLPLNVSLNLLFSQSPEFLHFQSVFFDFSFNLNYSHPIHFFFIFKTFHYCKLQLLLVSSIRTGFTSKKSPSFNPFSGHQALKSYKFVILRISLEKPLQRDITMNNSNNFSCKCMKKRVNGATFLHKIYHKISKDTQCFMATRT